MMGKPQGMGVLAWMLVSNAVTLSSTGGHAVSKHLDHRKQAMSKISQEYLQNTDKSARTALAQRRTHKFTILTTKSLRNIWAGSVERV